MAGATPAAVGCARVVSRTPHRPTWPVPIALGLLSGAGLVAGLVADGLWDVVSWVGLGVPLAVIAWRSLR